MSRAWWQAQRHYRDLKRRLDDEGFSVVEATDEGKRLRLSVERGGKRATLQVARSPQCSTHAVIIAVRQAGRRTG